MVSESAARFANSAESVGDAGGGPRLSLASPRSRSLHSRIGQRLQRRDSQASRSGGPDQNAPPPVRVTLVCIFHTAPAASRRLSHNNTNSALPKLNCHEFHADAPTVMNMCDVIVIIARGAGGQLDDETLACQFAATNIDRPQDGAVACTV